VGNRAGVRPPHRLAFSWIVELSAEQEQLVEIRFTAEDRGTRVELTHSGWEKLGDAAASLRERYDRGWGTSSSAISSSTSIPLQCEERRKSWHQR
jgi:uncharacterized protein YndB with AHSA1/START domain